MSVSAQLDRTRPAGGPAGPDPLAFRAVCGTFATGVTVVTADSPDRPQDGTVNSSTSLSADPPPVIVCLARTSRTWQAVEASGAFAVNILAADQRQVARLFASRASRPDADPLIFFRSTMHEGLSA